MSHGKQEHQRICAARQRDEGRIKQSKRKQAEWTERNQKVRQACEAFQNSLNKQFQVLNALLYHAALSYQPSEGVTSVPSACARGAGVSPFAVFVRLADLATSSVWRLTIA